MHFAIDEDAGMVTCPSGVTRPMSKTRTATFGAACTGCPLRGRCTIAKNNAWLHTRATAINLRTLLYAGLARRDWAWILA